MDDKKQKQEELKYLYKLYHDRDEEFEKAKGRRMLITFLGFSAFYAWLMWNILEPRGWDILWNLFLGAFMGGIHVFVNLCIFGPLCAKGMEESDRLRSIKKQIEELEKDIYS